MAFLAPIIEGGLPGLSRGYIAWGRGLLASLRIQYETLERVPKSFSFGGKPVLRRKLSYYPLLTKTERQKLKDRNL